MLYDPSKIRSVYIACGYTDMRKQIDGLAAIVEFQYKMEFNTESIFLFCGGKSDRIKILMWEGDGFVLLYKRLESGRFRWPRNPADVKPISWQQFTWLMQGLDIEQPTAIKHVNTIY